MSQINQLFQHYLGRGPQDFEHKMFEDEINGGKLDYFGLSNFLQGSSEYQRRQMPGMMKEYQDAIGGMNQDFVDKGMARGFTQANAAQRRLGRPNSDALASRYAQVSGNITSDLARSNFGVTSNMLANYYSGLSGGSRMASDAAVGNKYEMESSNRRFSQQQYLGAQDFDRQNSYLDRAYKQSRENNWYQLAGGLIGAGGQAGAAAIMMSDMRLKDNITRLAEIEGIDVVSFSWNETARSMGAPEGVSVGVLAQNVEQLHPELVGELHGFKAVNYAGLPVAVQRAIAEVR